MPLKGEAKRQYNANAYGKKRATIIETRAIIRGLKERDEEVRQFVADVDSSRSLPGEPLTEVQLRCVFSGFDKDADADAVEAQNKKLTEHKGDWNKIKKIRVSGRKLEGSETPITFDGWIARRKELRGALWDFGSLVTKQKGKWHEAHKLLFNSFVQKDNTTLPLNYTEDQLNQWLLIQSEKHNRMLLFPRGFRKSTAGLIDIAHWIVNAPDTIHVICTSTRNLGGVRVEQLKGFFTVKDYNRPTDFQCYFPEFCPESKGEAGEFRCPMAHLDIPYPTVSYTSVESSTAGLRATHITFDDACDEKNYREPKQRIKTIETFDAVTELLIRPYGYCTVIGTRYTDGLKGDNPEGRPENELDTRVPDLYGEITQRIESAGDESWLTEIHAAWETKPHAAAKLFKDYQPEDVELLMNDGPGLFSVLKEKAKKNERWFRCQQLNQPAAPLKGGGAEEYINTFTYDNIHDRVVNISEYPRGLQQALFVDTALTFGRSSDYSALAIAGIQEREDMNPLVWWPDYRALRESDEVVATTIAEMMLKWDCPAYIEDIYQPDSEPGRIFKNHVRREIQRRNIQHNVTWFKPDMTPGAKESRIRGLQLLHDLGLLRFVMCPQYDLLAKQLVEYNGDKKLHRLSKGGRKDDLPDVMSYVHKILPFVPGVHSEDEKLALEKKNEEAFMMAQYERIHGPRVMPSNPGPAASPVEEVEDNPIYRALGSNIGRPQISWPRRDPSNS